MAKRTLQELKTKGVMEYKTYVISDTIDRAGRHHREYAGDEYVTLIGGEQIKFRDWCKEYKEALKEAGKEELYTAVRAHIDHLVWLRTDTDKEEYALSCIDSEAYRSEPWKRSGFELPVSLR